MDSKQRFSSRVDNYIKYRPGYPPAVVDTLRANCGLSSSSCVADIGSGTGLLTRLFLELGCQVYGVEPNPEMRSAGERLLSGYPNFASRSGSAEATGLPDACVDLASAGQAFHWFDPALARGEFARILRPGGWIVLVWNARQVDATPFLRDYEALLQTFATDYNQVNHRNLEENPHTIPAFFGGEYTLESFDNYQDFDYPGLEGRLLSSSYAPGPGHLAHSAMLAQLRRIFDQHQRNGIVRVAYQTQVYYGRLA